MLIPYLFSPYIAILGYTLGKITQIANKGYYYLKSFKSLELIRAPVGLVVEQVAELDAGDAALVLVVEQPDGLRVGEDVEVALHSAEELGGGIELDAVVGHGSKAAFFVFRLRHLLRNISKMGGP